MQYQVGRTGRIIAARLSEGEDLYQCVEQIAVREGIDSAAVLIIGGCRQADVVVGPKQEKPKIVGDFRAFLGPGEILGVGTIYPDDQGPKLHIHAAFGKGDQTLVGCPRGGCRTFLVLEVTIIEITGLTAQRQFDQSSSLKLLAFPDSPT